MFYEKFVIFFITFLWIVLQLMDTYQVLFLFYTFFEFHLKHSKKHREIFLSQLNTSKELAQINEILSLLVPRFVKDLLIQGIKKINSIN